MAAGAAAEARLRGAADHLLRGDETGQGLGSLSPGRQEEEDGRMSSGGALSSSSFSSVASIAALCRPRPSPLSLPSQFPSLRWIATPLHGADSEEEDGRMSSGGAWSPSSSSTSSLTSDVESDDGDSGYPLTQCEYEEIPSFRWIASPLQWWKSRVIKNSKQTLVSGRPKEEEGANPPPISHFKRKTKTRSKTNHKLSMSDINVNIIDRCLGFVAKDAIEAVWKAAVGTGAYAPPAPFHRLTLGDGRHELAMRISSGRAINAGSRFEAQAHALGKMIRHPNIMALRAYCTWHQDDDGGPQRALVFDYMPRGSLSAFLQHSEPADAISMPERMKMAIGIARGLHHLHARCNMAHGNLTSRNVLLDADDHEGGVKIVDYGLIPQLAASAAAAVLGSVRDPPTVWLPGRL